jgi:hypothetical protein
MECVKPEECKVPLSQFAYLERRLNQLMQEKAVFSGTIQNKLSDLQEKEAVETPVRYLVTVDKRRMAKPGEEGVWISHEESMLYSQMRAFDTAIENVLCNMRQLKELL